MTSTIGAPAVTASVQARIQQIQARFTAPLVAPTTTTGTTFADTLQSATAGSVGTSSAGATATEEQTLSVAREYLGVPYVYGGTDPKHGLDCSGFVQLVYRRMGIELPRVTYDQVHSGVPVDRADLRPGDLVFSVGDGGRTNGHVGIYVGDGKWIAAPHTGDVVRIQPLPKDITAIRRVLPSTASTGGIA
jgi:cell wall-associated NlpC family hydrolase